MKQDNSEIPERYLPTLAIWHNLLRFWTEPSLLGKKIPPDWTIATNFYHGVRREYNKELLEILDGGGDAYTKIQKIRTLIAD